MAKLSHTDNKGRAIMVDVGDKKVQSRMAKAHGQILMAPETIRLIKENLMKKGDVLSLAQIAGISAAKQTAYLVPLCHNIVIDQVSVNMTVTDTWVHAESEVKCSGKTGVEMEALTAVSIALLTVYDMCKAVDKNMIISNIELTEKTKK
jgi:cyclic pyranopterin phosphate synthase